MTTTGETELQVPDRFEGLREAGDGKLRIIIVPVEQTLTLFDERVKEMYAAKRGALVVLRGNSGSGKSTFLDTVGFFRKDVLSERIAPDTDVAKALKALPPTTNPRVVVLEGREALGEVSEAALESAMHAINAFVRSVDGRTSLVVWPTNTDDLASRLERLGDALGRESLFGIHSPITAFGGPEPSQYIAIARSTVAALNDGASFASLGISDEKAVELLEGASTVGSYLARIRSQLLGNGARVRGLQKAERFRLWILVVAGNDPDGDVAALTRGSFADLDIDRLMTSTNANVVAELRKHPDDLGILATTLDAKILHLDVLTALAVARAYGDQQLRELMHAKGMSTKADPDAAASRLSNSELGIVLAGRSPGTRKRGPKLGSSTKVAFANLAEIARNNDGAINRAIGSGLVATDLAQSFRSEAEVESPEFKYISDLYIEHVAGPIRVEIMWRSKVGRADIANYSLVKLGQYAQVIGLLQ